MRSYLCPQMRENVVHTVKLYKYFVVDDFFSVSEVFGGKNKQQPHQQLVQFMSELTHCALIHNTSKLLNTSEISFRNIQMNKA